MASELRFNLTKTVPAAYKSFLDIEELIKASEFDPKLKHIVKLRVSQINECSFCVEMHSREALEDGENQERLNHLVVWSHTSLFSDPEKAALAWAEALTTKGQAPSLDGLHKELEKYFNQEIISLLTLVVVMINSWNRLQIAMEYDHF